jgi:hypothetical protein
MDNNTNKAAPHSGTDDPIKVEIQPTLQLIIFDKGAVLGSWGCESVILVALTENWAGLELIDKAVSGFIDPGQTCYILSREFLLAVRGALVFVPWQLWDTVEKFDTIIPGDAVISLIVSY